MFLRGWQMEPNIGTLTEEQLITIFNFAPRLLFLDGGKLFRDRLNQVCRKKLSSFGVDQKRRIQYLFKLVLSCGHILIASDELVWIRNELVNVIGQANFAGWLGLRAFESEGISYGISKKLLFAALGNAVADMNRGAPQRRINDFRRVQQMRTLILTKGYTRSQAAKAIAEAESRNRKDGIAIEESTIYRSFRRIEKELELYDKLVTPEMLLGPDEILTVVNAEGIKSYHSQSSKSGTVGPSGSTVSNRRP